MKKKTKFPPKLKSNPSPRNIEKIILRNKSKFELLAGANTPLEGLLRIFPKSTNPDALAGFCSALQGNSPCSVPQFVQNASKKVWESLALDPFADPADPSHMGKFAGLVENSTELNPAIKSKKSEDFLKIAHLLSDAAKMDAANASPEESKQFFDARIAAKKTMEKIEFSPQRLKIYLVISFAWREIEKLTSTNEFHQWLLAKKDAEGNTLIATETDSREIRKICQSIGLEFSNQWQAQKSQNVNPGPT